MKLDILVIPAVASIISFIVAFLTLAKNKSGSIKQRILTENISVKMRLFDNTNFGAAILNKDGIIIEANQKFCELLDSDKDTLIGIHLTLLKTKDDRNKLSEITARILKGDSSSSEIEFYKINSVNILDISSMAFELRGERYIELIVTDITEKWKLQNQLFHSQKMESIGVLAGGIAHDLNNMLTSVLGHSELLTQSLNLDSIAKKRFDTINYTMRKAGQMVSQLLGFARKGELLAVPMDLNKSLEDAIELLERVMKKKEIEIKKEFSNDLPVIKGDSAQLEQVIVNLLMNAGDAMSHSGTITVSTSVKKIEKNDNRYPLLTAGTYACMRISDTGTGIPNEILDKIFDPFFTTKAPGKGTGLGLAMVYGIVREHKGTIDVESQLGKGTTFSVYIPVAEIMAKPKVKDEDLHGNENILLIEDEAPQLDFTKSILSQYGYNVIGTDDPRNGLNIFTKEKDKFNLVITDIGMPEINGIEVIEKIRSINPNAKVLIITGFTVQILEGEKVRVEGFLQKPCSNEEMLSTVRHILDLDEVTSQN